MHAPFCTYRAGQIAGRRRRSGSHRFGKPRGGASGVVGHVYVNDNTAGENTVAGFDRHADGTLSPIPGSPFAVGGAGSGHGIGSQGALQLSADGRYLLAADAGSNQISVLRIKPNGSLTRAEGSPVASGGNEPVSIAVHDSLVYVANAGDGGSNYTGFTLNRRRASAAARRFDVRVAGRVGASPFADSQPMHLPRTRRPSPHPNLRWRTAHSDGNGRARCEGRQAAGPRRRHRSCAFFDPLGRAQRRPLHHPPDPSPAATRRRTNSPLRAADPAVRPRRSRVGTQHAPHLVRA